MSAHWMLIWKCSLDANRTGHCLNPTNPEPPKNPGADTGGTERPLAFLAAARALSI